MRARILLYFSLAVFFLPACDLEDCFTTKTNSIRFDFYSLEMEQPKTFRVLRLGLEGSDSILFANRNVRSDTLEVNPFDSTTQFNFDIILYNIDTVYEDFPNQTEIKKIDTLSRDTVSRYVKFSYDRSQRMISPECGVEQSIKNLRETETDFGRVEVIKDELERFDKVNVKIYL